MGWCAIVSNQGQTQDFKLAGPNYKEEEEGKKKKKLQIVV